MPAPSKAFSSLPQRPAWPMSMQPTPRTRRRWRIRRRAALNTRLATDETVVGNLDQYKSGAQTEIRFRPGQTVLSKEAKDALDQMAAQLKNQRGYIIEVQGFSSGKGQAAIGNSRKMADSVVRYLVLNYEIPGLSHLRDRHGQRGCSAGRERYARRSEPAEERSRHGAMNIPWR